MQKNQSACNAGDLDSIPGLGGSPGEGNSYPLQYSGEFRGLSHGITKSQTQLSDFTFTLTLTFFCKKHNDSKKYLAFHLLVVSCARNYAMMSRVLPCLVVTEPYMVCTVGII